MSPPLETSEDGKHAGHHVHEHRKQSESYGYANVDPLHHARDVYEPKQ
jgi:NCS1 family nucleobase:cation symporter-1